MTSRWMNGRRTPQVKHRRLTLEPLENRRLLAGVTTAAAVPAVADPGFSYVDVNNDGKYLVAAGDVALNHGELADGSFNTLVPEGNYKRIVVGAGLVVNGDPLSAANVQLFAYGNLTVNTKLTATGTARNPFGNVTLISSTGKVNLGGNAALTAARDISITAISDINVGAAVLNAGGSITFVACGKIVADGAEMNAGKTLILQGVRGVSADYALLRGAGELLLSSACGSVSARASFLTSTGAYSRIDVIAGGSIDIGRHPMLLSPTQWSSGGDVYLCAAGSITANEAVVGATNSVRLISVDKIFADATLLQSSKGDVQVTACNSVSMRSATLRA
jgi:hypothetical protein